VLSNLERIRDLEHPFSSGFCIPRRWVARPGVFGARPQGALAERAEKSSYQPSTVSFQHRSHPSKARMGHPAPGTRHAATYGLGLQLPNVFGVIGFGVIGAIVGRKLSFELQPEVGRHIFESCARGRIRRFEPPAAFGATKPPKPGFSRSTPASRRHGAAIPGGSRRPNQYRLLCRDETCRFAMDGSLRSRVLPDCSRKRVTRSGVADDR